MDKAHESEGLAAGNTKETGADNYRVFSVMFYGINRRFEVRATSFDAALADLRAAYADLGEVLTWGAR